MAIPYQKTTSLRVSWHALLSEEVSETDDCVLGVLYKLRFCLVSDVL